MISMQSVKHGCALPFSMSQDTLHDIQMLVQKGIGLPYNLCLVCHLPVDALGNLWHQPGLIREFYHTVWFWTYAVTCFHFSEIFTKVSMANSY